MTRLTLLLEQQSDKHLAIVFCVTVRMRKGC